MKLELTITEIAAKLGVSERTALRRIADGKLSAKKAGRNNYLVKSEDLDELAPRAKLATLAKQVEALQTATPGHLDTSSPETTEQITALAAELSYQSEILEAMKTELEDLRTRVTMLEQERITAPQPARSTPPTWPVESRVKSKRVQTPKETTSTRPLLPEHWSSWTPFVERHNVSSESRRLLKAIDKADYCELGEYMQPSKRGMTLVKCGLSPDSQARLLEAIKALPIFAPELRPCDVEGCPCHQLMERTLWE